jgi:hypothetical protein
MSDLLGATLPEELFRALSGSPPDPRVGEAILIATADPSGRPHPALLSYGEVRARDVGTLCFATYAASTTAQNLRERGAVTFCFIRAGSAVYVKARAGETGPAAALDGLARFEAAVEEVRRDRARVDLEGGTEITSGITFRVDDPAAQARRWSALHEALA